MEDMNSELKSLEKLSFFNIVKNFSRHAYAYASTKDENLKRNLHFLQRVYTEKLLEGFTEKYYLYKSILKKDYLDFLFNENLKRLVIGTDRFHFCGEEIFLQNAIRVAPFLESIILNGWKDEPDELMHIAKKLFPHTTNVVQIDIHYICNDDVIKVITLSCPHLKSLNINYSTVTGEGIKTLCFNSNGKIRTTSTLQILNISNTPLEITDVAFLVKNIPTLEEVKYSKLPAVIEYLYSSNKEDKTVQYNLQVLDFTENVTSNNLDGYLTACVIKCQKVKQMKIKVSKAEHLELVSRFLKLEHLEVGTFIDQNKCTNLSLVGLLACIGNNLKYLNIRGFPLPVSILIENCPNLENLELSDICYQEIDKNSTKLLHQLHTLEFGNVIFQNLSSMDSVIKLMNSTPKLETFTLYNCDFSKSDIASNLLEFFPKCSLKTLHFEYTDVEVSFLEQIIFSCGSLKTLSLTSERNLYDGTIDVLKKAVEETERNIQIRTKHVFTEWVWSDRSEEKYDSVNNYDYYNSDISSEYCIDSDYDDGF